MTFLAWGILCDQSLKETPISSLLASTIIALSLLLAVLPAAETTYSWRGIGSTGAFPAGDLVTEFWDYPADSSAARAGHKKLEGLDMYLPGGAEPGSRKNIVWRTELPDMGFNAPVVMGDRVFLLCDEGAESDAPQIICLDAIKGTILWQAPVDHLDAWSESKQKEAKAIRAMELRRWREHMNWWNTIYWDNEKNSFTRRDKASWDGITAKAREAGWIFPPYNDKNKLVERMMTQGRAPTPGGKHGANYRGRTGLDLDKGISGMPADKSLLDNYRRAVKERIYWRVGWTTEGPFYGNTMGSVVGDGDIIYAVTAFGGAAAFDRDGKRRWVTDLGIRPPKKGFHCSMSSPVLAGGVLCHYSYETYTLYGVDVKTGAMRFAVTSDGEPTKEGRLDSIQGHQGHMAPGGTPVVTTIDGALVVLSGSGLAVRISDGVKLGQLRFAQAVDGKGKSVGEYSSSYGSWAAHGDIVYATHFNGQLHAIQLGIKGSQLTQKTLWRSPVFGDNGGRDANLFIAHDRLFQTARIPRNGRVVHALELSTGKVLGKNPKDTNPGGYSTSLGVARDSVVWRLTTSHAPYWVGYSIGSLPDLKALGKGLLVNPSMSEAVQQRHIDRMGGPTIKWGDAGITCWGNRIFIRNNDYIWCIGDPEQAWVPPEQYLK